MTLLHAGLILLVLALLLLLVSGIQRRSTGLPRGRVITSDTGAWKRVDTPMYDAGLGLTGKPDYLVRLGDQFIPVEVKSGRTPKTPHRSHLFQLAAYCLLVEKTYGKRPAHGILHYPERDFEVEYTPALESALLQVLADMRRAEGLVDVPRSHEEPARCQRCGYRLSCDQKLS